MPIVDVAPLSSDDFRTYMGHFATGVTVITATDDGEPVGTTASAFSSLSLDPPMLLVCLNRSSHTGEIIHRTRTFAVNILSEDTPDLAMRFARKGPSKFDGISWGFGPTGVPLLQDALAAIECTVVEETSGGTHLVFIADARTGALRPGTPLAYYQGQFGRLEMEGDVHAARLIQNWIIENDRPRGSLLIVDDLAAQLALPRNIVYHALGKLRDEGLAYRDDDGGFRVATLSLKMVSEAIEARRTIELGVISRAADSLTDAQLASLRAAAERTLPSSAATRSENAWAEANRDFHDQLVMIAGNSSLANVYRQFNITAIVGRIQHDTGDHDTRELSAGEEHLKLVEALERRDEAAAAAAVMEHAEHALADMRALLAPQAAQEQS